MEISYTLELKILALAKQNPCINQRELSEQLAISLPTIKRIPWCSIIHPGASKFKIIAVR